MTSLKDDIILDLIENMEEQFNESPRSPASKDHKPADQLSHNKSFSKASLSNANPSKQKGGKQDCRNRLS